MERNYERPCSTTERLFLWVRAKQECLGPLGGDQNWNQRHFLGARLFRAQAGPPLEISTRGVKIVAKAVPFPGRLPLRHRRCPYDGNNRTAQPQAAAPVARDPTGRSRRVLPLRQFPKSFCASAEAFVSSRPCVCSRYRCCAPAQ